MFAARAPRLRHSRSGTIPTTSPPCKRRKPRVTSRTRLRRNTIWEPMRTRSFPRCSGDPQQLPAPRFWQENSFGPGESSIRLPAGPTTVCPPGPTGSAISTTRFWRFCRCAIRAWSALRISTSTPTIPTASSMHSRPTLPSFWSLSTRKDAGLSQVLFRIGVLGRSGTCPCPAASTTARWPWFGTR